MPNEKLVFVYLGKRLPRYARKSLNLAREYSGFDIILICEKRFHLTGLDKKETYLLSSHYKKRLSQNEIKPAVAKFRNGKTIERFFALEEYMRLNNIDQCFHAELDNLVFANDGLANKLNSFGAGLFIPFDDPNRAIASFIYINSIKTLEGFCLFAEHGHGNYNDMELLAMYGAINSSEVFALPSSIENHNLKSGLLEKGIETLNEFDIGIFDAAAIGQWYFGIDPRNSYFKTCNQFINTVSNLDLSQFRMRMSEKDFNFYAHKVGDCEKEFLVNNLHIHSKIHSQISSAPRLLSLVKRTDAGEIVVIRRNIVGKWRALKDLALWSLERMSKIVKVQKRC